MSPPNVSVTRAPVMRMHERMRRRGMAALVRLEVSHGDIAGFSARSFVKAGQEAAAGRRRMARLTRWPVAVEGGHELDEIVGHFIAYRSTPSCSQRSEKPALRAGAQIGSRRTSSTTIIGCWVLPGNRRGGDGGAPAAIWKDPDETGLRALHMLSHLRVAGAPDRRFRAPRALPGGLQGPGRNAQLPFSNLNQKVMVPGHVNHSDDELAFLSFYPLLRYERDPELLGIYRQSLERSWQTERPERNPLSNVVYAVGTGAAEFDRAEALRTLHEMPVDQIQWSVKNSNRKDVPVDPMADRFQHAQALIVLPYDELPMWKWNGNPYLLDGGFGGRSEDDGAAFLLPVPGWAVSTGCCLNRASASLLLSLTPDVLHSSTTRHG